MSHPEPSHYTHRGHTYAVTVVQRTDGAWAWTAMVLAHSCPDVATGTRQKEGFARGAAMAAGKALIDVSISEDLLDDK